MSEDRQPVFSCRNLRVEVEGKRIVRGVDLTIHAGERHALMGPNGSGKSTLAAAIMGDPGLRLSGELYLDGRALTQLGPDERARAGLFLGFQHPVPVPGVSVATFLRAAMAARQGRALSIRDFQDQLLATFAELGIAPEFAQRYLNDGFSGGEKKRLEILQMLMLKPRFALLDEIDSGLDIDALKIVSRGIRRAAEGGTAVLMITHYQRILDHVQPRFVHVFAAGRIAKSGGAELARELEEHGYDTITAAAV